MSRLLRHLRTNVVAYLALFVALGGTGAYAANTVFSSDIVDGEVKTPDIAANAVNSQKLKNAGVAAADLATGSVTAAKVAGDALGGAQIDEGSLGEVPDAGRLDGLDASAFVAGPGSALTFTRNLLPGSSTASTGGDFALPGFGSLAMSCPADPETTLANMVFTASDTQTAYLDDGRVHPVVELLTAGGTASNPLHNFGDLVTLHTTRHASRGTMTVTIAYTPFFSVIAQATRCRVSAQALLTP